jgi:hypothetical protein
MGKRYYHFFNAQNQLKNMSLLKQQSILNNIKINNDLKVISIKTSSDNFNKRFKSSVSLFWKSFKNGLYSIRRTNREFFKGISGVYFSLQIKQEFQILILYDNSKTILNEIEIKARIKKLIGQDTEVKLGVFQEYEETINEILGIRQKVQPFGDYYFKHS